MIQQFILREYSGGGQSILDTINCIEKRVYNTKDIIYLKEDKVIGVKPWDYQNRTLYYIDQEQFKRDTIRVDSISLPKLTREQETYLRRHTVLSNLKKEEKRYDKGLLNFFKVSKTPITEVTKAIVLKMFNIVENL